jgi:hypothetical protein
MTDPLPLILQVDTRIGIAVIIQDGLALRQELIAAHLAEEHSIGAQAGDQPGGADPVGAELDDLLPVPAGQVMERRVENGAIIEDRYPAAVESPISQQRLDPGAAVGDNIEIPQQGEVAKTRP